MSLVGKVAIVTGAAQGLGRAVAKMFVERGASVVLADVDVARGEAAARELGEKARFFRLDVWNEEQWVEAIALARSAFGGYDILVNNAAIYALTSIEHATKDDWLRIFQVNAGGIFLGCKHAILSMKETGGSIVNVSSNSSLSGMRQIPIYTSSKGAINALTRSIVAHCKHDNLPIRCNTVVPGGMRSGMTRSAMMEMVGVDIESGTAEAAGLMVAANMVSPDQVAEVIAFLASDAARRVNGAEILADGGDAVLYILEGGQTVG